MADKKRINGNVVSWGSIKVKLNGETFYGFTSLSYGHKRERNKLWGMGVAHAPRGRTRGKYSTDPVKLKGPKSTIEALRQSLALLSVDGVSYGDVEFEIVAQYIERDEPEMLVEIQDCVIVAEASNEEENPDALQEEIEIDCMRIYKNGLTLFDSSEGAP